MRTFRWSGCQNSAFWMYLDDTLPLILKPGNSFTVFHQSEDLWSNTILHYSKLSTLLLTFQPPPPPLPRPPLPPQPQHLRQPNQTPLTTTTLMRTRSNRTLSLNTEMRQPLPLMPRIWMRRRLMKMKEKEPPLSRSLSPCVSSSWSEVWSSSWAFTTRGSFPPAFTSKSFSTRPESRNI